MRRVQLKLMSLRLNLQTLFVSAFRAADTFPRVAIHFDPALIRLQPTTKFEIPVDLMGVSQLNKGRFNAGYNLFALHLWALDNR